MSTKKAAKQQKNQYIQVFVRCRPLNPSEQAHRSSCVVDIQGPKEVAIHDRNNSKTIKSFSFDKVFGPSNSQVDVYQNVVEPLIADVLSGYNCTVFAYGQTGSGKTYTMEGDLEADPIFSVESKAGVIPRAMCALFDELHVLESEYTVRISFLELYNEDLYDLLSPDDIPPKLRLFDDSTKKGSVIIQGLQEVMVHTQSQILQELRKGSAKRQAAATLLNANSSRSHTIFCVTVHSKENSVDGEELLKTGKLYLVDLAGSENIARSGSVDKRAREAANINQSLLTLGRVISCLVEHQPHVPYRESKLTRLLQDSLGGRTKTSMIATISPAHTNIEETLSTLDYALRAKSVANKPEVNRKVSQKVIMKEYMDVIDDLKKKLELHRSGSGVYLNDDNYRQLIDQNREMNRQLSEKIAEIRAVCQKIKYFEDIFGSLTSDLESHKLNLENTERTIEKNSEEIVVVSEQLSKATLEKEEASDLLSKLCEHENELQSQAKYFTNITDSTKADEDKIFRRLDLSKSVIQRNTEVFSKVRERVKIHSAEVRKMLSSLHSGLKILLELLMAAEKQHDDVKNSLEGLSHAVHSLTEKTKTSLGKFQSVVQKLRDDQKANAQSTKLDLVCVWSDFDNDLKSVVEVLRDTCAEYQHLISQLPQQFNNFVDFATKCSQNIQSATHLQLDELRRKYSGINITSDQNIKHVLNLLEDLLKAQQMPYIEVKKNLESWGQATSVLKQICLNSRKEITAHSAKLTATREDFMKDVTVINEKMESSVKYLEDQRDEVPMHCNDLMETLSSGSKPLLNGLQDQAQHVKENIWNSLATYGKVEETINRLLSRDVPLDQFLEVKKDDRAQSVRLAQDNGLVCVNDLMKMNTQLSQDLSLKLKDIAENDKKYEHKEDEIFDMYCEGIESTSIEIAQHLENQKTSVTQLVQTELSHDVPTGDTPVKRSLGPIPQLTTLPSPVIKKVKSRVQNAIAFRKRSLRSPRKPLSSSKSFQDFDDDCMASDSELTFIRKSTELSGLQKASSLTDLRSKAVFNRPRVPKKYSRKVQ